MLPSRAIAMPPGANRPSLASTVRLPFWLTRTRRPVKSPERMPLLAISSTCRRPRRSKAMSMLVKPLANTCGPRPGTTRNTRPPPVAEAGPPSAVIAPSESRVTRTPARRTRLSMRQLPPSGRVLARGGQPYRPRRRRPDASTVVPGAWAAWAWDAYAYWDDDPSLHPAEGPGGRGGRAGVAGPHGDLRAAAPTVDDPDRDERLPG